MWWDGDWDGAGTGGGEELWCGTGIGVAQDIAGGVLGLQGVGSRVRGVCCMEVQIVRHVDEHLGDIVVSSDRGAVV